MFAQYNVKAKQIILWLSTVCELLQNHFIVTLLCEFLKNLHNNG